MSGSVPDYVLFYTGNESPVEEYVNNTGRPYPFPARSRPLPISLSFSFLIP